MSDQSTNNFSLVYTQNLSADADAAKALLNSESRISSITEGEKTLIDSADGENPMSENSNETLATTSTYSASDFYEKLKARGVNPLRAEILAIIEFIPLAAEQLELDVAQSETFQDYTLTRAGHFAELQRLLKENSFETTKNLLEKESGMSIALFQLVVNFFRKIIINLTPEEESEIFNSADMGICTQNLLNMIRDQSLTFLSNANIYFVTERNLNVRPYFEGVNNQSFIDPLNFNLNEEGMLFLLDFVQDNVSNFRIITLAKSAIGEAFAAGILINTRIQQSLIDDLRRAIMLDDLLYPDLGTNNTSTINQIVQGNSFDITGNKPLEAAGMSINPNQNNQSYSAEQLENLISGAKSNVSIFLNTITMLIGDMTFLNESRYNPVSLLAPQSSNTPGNYSHYLNFSHTESIHNTLLLSTTYTTFGMLNRLSKLSHASIIPRGNLSEADLAASSINYSSESDMASLDVMNFITELISADNTVRHELFAASVYDEVVGDNFILSERSLTPGFGSFIKGSSSVGQGQPGEFRINRRYLLSYINEVLFKTFESHIEVDSTSENITVDKMEWPHSYYSNSQNTALLDLQTDMTALIDDMSQLEDLVSTTAGFFTKLISAPRNERDENLIPTTNAYIPTETSKTIDGSDFLVNNTSLLIPSEDALLINRINSPGFTIDRIDDYLNPLMTHANSYAQNVEKLTRDIINMYGIGYVIDETDGLSEIKAQSKGILIKNKGMTPRNYANFYLEGLLTDLEEIEDALTASVFEPNSALFTLVAYMAAAEDASGSTSENKINALGALGAFWGSYFGQFFNPSYTESYKSEYDDFIGTPAAIIKIFGNIGSNGINRVMDKLFISLLGYPENKLNTSEINSFPGKYNTQNSSNQNAVNKPKGILYGTTANDVHKGGDMENHKVVLGNKNENFGIPQYTNAEILNDDGKDANDNIHSLVTRDGYLAEKLRLAYSTGEFQGEHHSAFQFTSTGGFIDRLKYGPMLYEARGEPNNGHFESTWDGITSFDDLFNQKYVTPGQRPLYKKNSNDNFILNGVNPENANNSTINAGGIIGLSKIKQSLPIFYWYLNFLKTCLTVEFQTGNTTPIHYKHATFRINMSKDQVKGAKAGLRFAMDGKNNPAQPTAESLQSEGRSSLYINAYFNAIELGRSFLDSIDNRQKLICTKLNLLLINAKDLQKTAQNIKSRLTSLANNQIDSISSASSQFVKNLNTTTGLLSNVILTQDKLGSMTKYFYDHFSSTVPLIGNYSNFDLGTILPKSLQESPIDTSFPFSPYDKRPLQEYITMYKILTTSGYNLYNSDRKGRKNIINIAIPQGLINTLTQQAYTKTADSDFLQSTLIVIHVHRKNELDDREEVFPRPFVFDTSKFVCNRYLESQSSTLCTTGFVTNEAIMNANSLVELSDTMPFLTIDKNFPDSDKIGFIPNGTGRTSMGWSLVDGAITTEGNYDTAIIDDVCNNHIFDYFLKLYQNLMLNIQMEEYNFLLEKNDINTGGPLITNKPGFGNLPAGIYEKHFTEFLRQFYPAFNVDNRTGHKISHALAGFNALNFINIDSKINQFAANNCFDRTFSIVLSDRDFLIDTSKYNDKDMSEIFSSIPNVRVSQRRLLTPTVIASTDVSDPTLSNYVKSVASQNTGAVYKYFATISVLKRW